MWVLVLQASLEKPHMWPNSSFNSFLLTGFPDLEAAHHWISTPFLFFYLSVLFGDGILLLLIKGDHNLHEPMYYFLSMLELDLTQCWESSWLDYREIGNVACFPQAYLIYLLSFVKFGVLLAMA